MIGWTLTLLPSELRVDLVDERSGATSEVTVETALLVVDWQFGGCPRRRSVSLDDGNHLSHRTHVRKKFAQI